MPVCCCCAIMPAMPFRATTARSGCGRPAGTPHRLRHRRARRHAASLAQRLDAPAICTRFSRLLIDPNRGLDDPTLIMRISDGAVVPGNRRLDAAERDRRVRLYYEPYHQRIDGLIEQCVAAGVPPVLLSVHSFTESWKGEPRPWHAAILWDRDYRFSVPLLEALRAEAGVARRRERALRRQARRRLHVAARHAARPRAYASSRCARISSLARRPARVGRAHRPPPCSRCSPAPIFARRCIACSTSARTPTPTARRPSRARRKGTRMTDIDPETATELEAAAFRRLVAAFARAHRRAEHRPDESRRLLPQLPVELVPGGGGASAASISARTRRARSSTACPTRSGSSAIRRKPRPRRRRLSPKPARLSHKP